MMNSALKNIMDHAQDLPDNEQERLAGVMAVLIENWQDQQRLETDLSDNAYAAELDNALADGEQDVAAGRLLSAEEIIAASDARLDKLNG